MKIVTSILAAFFSVAAAAQAAGELHALVQDSRTKHELLMDPRDGAEAADTNGVKWRLGVESGAVAGHPDAQDYRLTWTVTTGQVESASVGVVFEFKDWSPENFVFVPAAVYAWEGVRTVGGSILGSCSWVETAALLTVTELPGLYVQPDAGLAVAFDNVRVEEVTLPGKTVKFRLTNPTKCAANVSVLVESAKTAQRPVGSFVLKPLPVVHLEAGAFTTLEYTASRSSGN